MFVAVVMKLYNKTFATVLLSFITCTLILAGVFLKSKVFLKNNKISEVCSKYKQVFEDEVIEPSRFVYNTDHKMLGCLINKVGSTTLLETFLKLKNIDANGRVWDYRHLIVPNDDTDMKNFKNFYKFVIVREPMERLASCYYDKILVNSAPGLQKFKLAIKKKSDSRNNNVEESEVSFTEFLQVLVLGNRGNVTNFGRHWLPYYKLCTPCSISYDYIGRLENLSEIWNSSGLQSLAPLTWKNKKMSNETYNYKAILQTVPRSILVKVYQRIKLDYELFDYDFNKVLELGNYDKLNLEEDIFVDTDSID